MGAMLSSCTGKLTNNPKHLEMITKQVFGMFDKDKSGFIDGTEAKAAANKVVSMAKIPGVTPAIIDSVFNKVAGPDHKLDKAEFNALIGQLVRQKGATPVATATPASRPAAVPAH